MTLLSVVGALLVASAPACAQSSKVYRSPDRVLKAVVWIGPTRESRVEIRTAAGRVLQVHDERSRDGSHGHSVVHAEWTSDSQFFVAGTESTGGHQPWAHPIWIYARAKNRVFALEKMGATAVADFILEPPDVVRTKVLDCDRGGDSLSGRPFVISLHQLVESSKLPAPPCPAPSK